MISHPPSFSRPIFISHAEEDSDIAHAVAQNLHRRLTPKLHLDKYFLTAGAQWKDKIEAELKSSELLILLVSRVIAGGLAPGVVDELNLAAKYNIPVVVGLIRNLPVPDRFKDFQVVNFGERGDREEAMWEIARFLLINSSPFAPLGFSGVFFSRDEASAVVGTTEQIAQEAKSVIVIGHTLKAWLSDYASAIRSASAGIDFYIPSDSDLGMPLLEEVNRAGPRILKSIQETRRELIEIIREIGAAPRVRCFHLRVKPMFSVMAIDIDLPAGCIVVDNYLYRVSSENRPRMLLRGPGTPLFQLYKGVLNNIISDATQIA